MIENKLEYKGKPEIFFILEQLEKAITNQDKFGVSILTTRLANKGLQLREINESSNRTKSTDQKQRNSNNNGRTNCDRCGAELAH